MTTGFIQRFKGKISASAASIIQFGKGALSFGLSGNIAAQLSGAGINPGATAADNVLAVFSLPANAFDIAGRGINILAMGSFANNTNTKTVKIIYNPATAVVGSTVGAGGTTIATGASSTTAAAGGWSLEANVYKYGAPGSNTQLGLHTAFQSGNAVGALSSPSALTATEGSPILIAITGNAATLATDIALNFLEVFATN